MGEIKHKMHFCLVVSALALKAIILRASALTTNFRVFTPSYLICLVVSALALKAIILRASALTTNFRVFTPSYLKRTEIQNYSRLKPIYSGFL